MVVALGVTLEGDKVFLGFVQTDTENAVVIRSFLRGLKDEVSICRPERSW